MIRRLLVFALGAALPVLATDAPFDAATAANQFGLDLYRQLAALSPHGNLVLSPYSVDSALVLAYAGADGATRREMGAALHFPADDAALQTSFGVLRTSLQQLVSPIAVTPGTPQTDGDDERPVAWQQITLLFGQRGYDFRPSFLSHLKDDCSAPFASIDFRTEAEAGRQAINAWIARQTHGKIHDLIPVRGLNHRTRLVLVNALYLKAPWKSPFEEAETRPRSFAVPGIEAPKVPIMRQTADFHYAKEAGLTVVALDYAGCDLQFLILLPDEGTGCDALAARLAPKDFKTWAELGEKSRPTLVTLYLPKFRIEGLTQPLGSALRTLGMKQAFDEPRGSADFSRIAPRQPDDALSLSEVFHQTSIAVDEKGTEASAATALALATLGISSEPPRPIIVRVDRPFLFVIQHRATGICLFLGRITDPR